eukprot:scaffold160_cov333-Pavlova_lutheri.AAC.3
MEWNEATSFAERMPTFVVPSLGAPRRGPPNRPPPFLDGHRPEPPEMGRRRPVHTQETAAHTADMLRSFTD